MKLDLKQYLAHSSVFIIFSEGFFFNYIIDWKLMYLIVITNYLLLFHFFQIKVHRYFYYLLIFIALHAVVCYSILLIPPNYFLSQIIGIGITGVYFYNIFKVVEFNLLKNIYLKYSFYVALLGFVFYFIGYNPFAYFKNEARLMSIFKEPAHYVVVVIPACYYFFKTKQYIPFFTILISIILSQSSLGYIGIGLMFILPYISIKRLVGLTVALPFVILAFLWTYEHVERFQMRVDDTLENLTVLHNGKFNEYTNLSSYVLLSNLYIAKKNMTDHPLGSGIGSHHYMFTERYYAYMRPPGYLVTIGHDKDNSFDANSLLTRLISEFGILGILFVLYCSLYFVKGFSTPNYLLNGLIIYFILKLLRDGTYFPPELFFFVWMYVFDLKKMKNEPKSLSHS